MLCMLQREKSIIGYLSCEVKWAKGHSLLWFPVSSREFFTLFRTIMQIIFCLACRTQSAENALLHFKMTKMNHSSFSLWQQKFFICCDPKDSVSFNPHISYSKWYLRNAMCCDAGTDSLLRVRHRKLDGFGCFDFFSGGWCTTVPGQDDRWRAL